MARRVTVTFDDGTSHVYENVPDDATPDEVSQRAFNDFGKRVTALDGGRGTPEPKAGFLESTARDLLSGFGNAAATVARGGATVAKAFLPEGNSLPQTLEDAAFPQRWKQVHQSRLGEGSTARGGRSNDFCAYGCFSSRGSWRWYWG